MVEYASGALFAELPPAEATWFWSFFLMKSSSTIPLCELQSWFLSHTGVIDQLHLGLANERLCSSGESIGGSRASSFSITSKISQRSDC